MALSRRLPSSPFRLLSHPSPRSWTPKCRFYSSDLPNQRRIMQDLRNDFNNARKKRNAPVVSVLRSLFADIDTSISTQRPIESVSQLLTLMRKKLHGSREAIAQAYEQDRMDRVRAEEEEAKVLEGYVRALEGEMVGEEEIRESVGKAVEELKHEGYGGGEGKATGMLIRMALKRLEGKEVDRSLLSDIVKEVVHEQGLGKS